MSEKEYRKKWELKHEWYIKQGVLPLKNGNLPDSDKVLVTTQDNPDNPMGGIDSRDVEKIISLIKS